MLNLETLQEDIMERLCEILLIICAIGSFVQCKVYVPVTSTECQPTGTLTRSPTAVEVQEIDHSAYASVQYQLTSNIMCATTSNNQKGVAYDYQGGICTIYGPGQGTTKSSLYFGLPAFPHIDTLEEVAHAKPTYTNSEKEPYLKEYAVDGTITTNLESMYHSELDPPFWWMVDLEEIRRVHQIQIFTRQDCCSDRLHDIEVRLGTTRNDSDVKSYTLISTYEGPYSTSQGYIHCSHAQGVTGRYLTIMKFSNDADALQLVEVFVYAKKVGP